MSFACIPVQFEPNKSPLRKRLLALLLWEISHLSSPNRSCLGRFIFIRGGLGVCRQSAPTSVEENSSLTQNFTQISCSTGSVILNVTATLYTCSLNGVYCLHWLVQWSHHCSHMNIPVHSPWLPCHINVLKTILVILTMAGLCQDRPCVITWNLHIHFLLKSFIIYIFGYLKEIAVFIVVQIFLLANWLIFFLIYSLNWSSWTLVYMCVWLYKKHLI